MTEIQIVLPAMGEGITDATITKWLVVEGDEISEEDPVVEIATDKVDSEIAAPVNGKLIKILVKEGEIANVGQILAIVETKSEKAPQKQIPTQKTRTINTTGSKEHKNEIVFTRQEFNGSLKYIPPFIRSLANDFHILPDELYQIQGSGKNGAITKQDVIDFANVKKPNHESYIPHTSDTTKKTEISLPKEIRDFSFNKTPIVPDENSEIIQMSRMRQLIAEHTRASKLTAPHVTSFIEADVTVMMQWRNLVKNEFLEKEKEKLTVTPIIVEAVAQAILDHPMINISVQNDKIILKKDINIGVATALEDGNLIVPVIKSAHKKNLKGLAKSVNELVYRARNNQLDPAQIKGGTFTITNLGTFESLTGTPIINQPEVAILAVGAVNRKPAVVKTKMGETIGIRDIMMLALSYDHRVIDGQLGGVFLKKIRDILENFDINRKI